MESIVHCNPLNDVYFKYIFGSVERKFITLAFLNAVLGLTNDKALTDVMFINVEMPPAFELGKMTRLDIHAQTLDGTRIDIEVQVAPQRAFMDRMLYYWSGSYHRELARGEDYDHLSPVIVVAITNFKVTGSGDAHSVKAITDLKTGELATDKLAIHLLELPKQQAKPVDQMTPLEQWMAFLNMNPKDFDERLKEDLTMANPAIAAAYNAERQFMQSEAQRLGYLDAEMARIDNYSIMRTARETGLAQGRTQGLFAVVRNMLAKGVTEVNIADLTGIPLDEVRQLRSDAALKDSQREP